MPPIRTAGLPLYAQLKETILGDIARGHLKPGDQIPSQRELCERHHMSHMTVRRALSELLNEGAIYALAGKGIYVAQPKQAADAGPFVSFHEDMARRGLRAEARVLEAAVVPALVPAAEALGVPVGSPVVYLRRLLLGSGTPFTLATSYLPDDLVPGVLDHDLEEGSLFATLRQVYGLRMTRSRRTVDAILADEDQAQLLGLALPAALLQLEEITYLDTGRAIEFSRNLHRGDRARIPLS
jgi:GntR family transcriptional regulator